MYVSMSHVAHIGLELLTLRLSLVWLQLCATMPGLILILYFVVRTLLAWSSS